MPRISTIVADMRTRRAKRELHGLNADGMVACNPRDREAAHRARMHGIATENLAAVTCRKCRTMIHKTQRDRPKSSEHRD